MSFLDEMRCLIREIDDNNEAASALWTWLPSHQETIWGMENEGLNSDYVHEQQPSAASIMNEACEVIAYLLGYTELSPLSAVQKDIIETKRVNGKN